MKMLLVLYKRVKHSIMFLQVSVFGAVSSALVHVLNMW